MYFPQFGVLDLSLLRRSLDADPISPLQPQAAYYVTRNLATMLDELEPGEPEYSIDRAATSRSVRLEGPDGHALAIWLGGRANDRKFRWIDLGVIDFVSGDFWFAHGHHPELDAIFVDRVVLIGAKERRSTIRLGWSKRRGNQGNTRLKSRETNFGNGC